MLQQTRVITVLPYFDRWTKSFPDFETLACAEEGEVLQHWQGLGYYSRARNLHRLSKRVAADGIPETREGWKSLPGIGDYTSAAIMSIALGVPEAVVDGNVVRVLARLTADDTPWKSAGDAVRSFQSLADGFLNPDHPGSHNESVMELGALVCTPRTPLCTVCPLVSHCRGAASGLASSLPRIKKASKVKKTVRRAWIFRRGKVLLRRVPANAKRLAGMVELPRLDTLPQRWNPLKEPFAKKKRGIGNELITEWFYRVENCPDLILPEGSDLFWRDTSCLNKEAISGPHRKWISEFLEGGIDDR